MSKADLISHPLTIAFINQTFGLGGAETFLTDLLADLQDNRACEISVFTTHRPFGAMLSPQGFRSAHLPISIDIIGNWKGLLKTFVYFPFALLQYGWVVWRSRNVDVILLSGYPEKAIVSWFARIFGVPTVWIEFGPLESVFQKFGGFPKWWYHRATQLPERVIVPSTNTLRAMQSQTDIPKKRFELIPCGRKIELGEVDRINVTEVKNRIVCVSRFELGKGQDLLVQAFQKVKQEIPDAELVFVGEGDFQLRVQAEVERLQLTDSVHFLGRVPNVWQEISQASVCVFPSTWALEGFGMVTIEAMAMEKAVVGFDTGPTPDLIQHNQNGLLAKEGDVNDLAKQIVRLLKDKKLRQKLGEQARQDFVKRYTIEVVGKQYFEVLQRVKAS